MFVRYSNALYKVIDVDKDAFGVWYGTKHCYSYEFSFAFQIDHRRRFIVTALFMLHFPVFRIYIVITLSERLRSFMLIIVRERICYTVYIRHNY